MILLTNPKVFPALDPAKTENNNAIAASVIDQNLGNGLMFMQMVLGNWNGTLFIPSAWYPSITIDLNPATLQMSVNSLPIALVTPTQLTDFRDMFKGIEKAFELWFVAHYGPNFAGTVI